MTSTKFLKFALPTTLVPAALALLLPAQLKPRYAEFIQPALLLANFVLALWVARMYRDDLRHAFLFLAGFLFFYSLVIIEPVIAAAQRSLGENFLTALVVYQVITYAMLLIACFNILKVIGVTKLDRHGWYVVAIALVFGAAIVAYLIPTFRDSVAVDRLAGVLFLLIRIFDVLVMVMLVPVLWLYAQNQRQKYQESASFTTVVIGIVASLILVYVYELIRQTPLIELAQVEFRKGSLLDGLYIFGYLVIAVGLFAHRKHQEWSFKAIDNILV